MKLLITSIAATALLTTTNASTFAGDWYGWGNRHFQHHQSLRHNEFHRQQYHWNAHRYPMTYGQHFRLHQNLNHDRYHDALRHQNFHYRGGSRLRFGFGF